MGEHPRDTAHGLCSRPPAVRPERWSSPPAPDGKSGPRAGIPPVPRPGPHRTTEYSASGLRVGRGSQQPSHPVILGESPRPESKAKVMGRNGTPIGDVRHGHALRGIRSATYYSWQNMLARCRHASVPSYSRYGGRGITVCDRWGTFENFLADMGERPPGLTLDRMNNDGNYEPSNCRWATRREQIRHCRKDDSGRWS